MLLLVVHDNRPCIACSPQYQVHDPTDQARCVRGLRTPMTTKAGAGTPPTLPATPSAADSAPSWAAAAPVLLSATATAAATTVLLLLLASVTPSRLLRLLLRTVNRLPDADAPAAEASTRSLSDSSDKSAAMHRSRLPPTGSRDRVSHSAGRGRFLLLALLLECALDKLPGPVEDDAGLAAVGAASGCMPAATKSEKAPYWL